jgi:hypothetical protein
MYFGRTVTTTRSCAGIDEDQQTLRGSVCPRRVQTFRPVLPHSHHLAAATGADDAFGFDDLFDPLQMLGQVSLVAFARSPFRRGLSQSLVGRIGGGGQHALGHLDVFGKEVPLIGARLLGVRPELLVPGLGQKPFQPGIRLRQSVILRTENPSLSLCHSKASLEFRDMFRCDPMRA